MKYIGSYLKLYLFGIIFILLPSTAAFAQNPGDISGAQVPTVPDTLSGWILNWTTGLNVSQAAYSNWSKGGVNSLSLNSSTNINVMYQSGQFAYDLLVRSRYGQAMIEDEGMRKTDDQLMFRNRFLADVIGEGNFKLFGNFNMNTQLAKGYNYGGGEDGRDVLISDFFTPLQFIQNTGIAFIPNSGLFFEAGLGLKQTIIRNRSLSTNYGLEENEFFKSEAGATFGINVKQELMDDVTYTGYFETFTTINRAFLDSSVFFSNLLEGRVNNYIRLVFQFDMIYDPDFSKELQIGQLLSAGLTVNIF